MKYYNIKDIDLNKVDCTFYFIINDENKYKALKDEARNAVCEHLAQVVDVAFYRIRSGPSIRSSRALKQEWDGTIPEQIKIVVVDPKKEDVTLLSGLQRDMFFDMVMESTEDLDTLSIVEYVFNETEKSQT